MFFSKSGGGKYDFILAGLGNPGKKYENTRHNTGFMCIDGIAESEGFKVVRSKFDCLCGDAVIGGRSILVLKPQTFMNLSGTAIEKAASFYKIPPQNVVVICDDVALPLGALRIRKKGSSGGQNGLRNIIDYLGTEEFVRVRIGIGDKPNPNYDLADWVLSRYTQGEIKTLSETFERAEKALELIFKGNCDLAMSKYNG